MFGLGEDCTSMKGKQQNGIGRNHFTFYPPCDVTKDPLEGGFK